MKFVINVPVEITIDDDVNAERMKIVEKDLLWSLRGLTNKTSSGFWRVEVKGDKITKDDLKRAMSTAKYNVVAGRRMYIDLDTVEDMVSVRILELDAETAKKEYHKCRGYDFSRIEREDEPGVDVSDELFGVK